MEIEINKLTELEAFAISFSKNIKPGDVIFLQGDLGSGKTTFTQFLLKQLGYNKRVKSPTYAIYETYELAELSLVHMDLYRLGNPEELYYLAIEEIFNQDNIVLIEWPEKGTKVLPDPSFELTFTHNSLNKRTVRLTQLTNLATKKQTVHPAAHAKT